MSAYPKPAFEKGKTRALGRPLTRLEDLPLVTGKGRYVGDMGFPHQLYMRVVRTDQAHGKIVAIHLDEARAMPGVVAIWTAADIADLPLIDFRDPAPEALNAYRQPLLARDRVRYVGEPIAVVFADSPHSAEDAAEYVMLEVEELPVLLDGAAAPREFEPGRSTEAYMQSREYGDVDAVFRDAYCVLEADLSVGRHSAMPMECRGAIGRYDAAYDMLELWGAAKVPHRNRESLSRFFDRPPSSIQLHEGHVGGGFGVRGELYPEDFLVLAASMRLGRPIKWIEDRREHIVATNHSRQQRHKVRVAIDAEGRILGFIDEFYLDQGAYIRTHGARVIEMTIGSLIGPYVIPAFRCIAHMRLTNKTPAATYRSPGRYEATFVRERMFDAIAHRLGLDRAEVCRRNLIPADRMPYTTDLVTNGHALVLDSGDYAGLLKTALDAFGWDAVEAELRERRAQGEAVGLGFCYFLEKSGHGPSDSALVSVDAGGFVEVVTGGASVGQGFETAMAQICAETLGVDYRRIRIVHGQTDRIRYGVGAHASRATVMTGNAVHVAASQVREKALALAAMLLQAPADELDITDGIVARRGAPDGPSVSLGTLSRQCEAGQKSTANGSPGLFSEGWFHTEHIACPYGLHLAVVRVDRDTAIATVERYFVANDVGRAVNPMLVDGQITGGVAQGLGGALYEEFRYDESGQPLSVTLADYLVPTMNEIPHIEVMIFEDAPSPFNPLGVKGAGEAGCTGVGAAIASAIDAALQMPGAVTALPVTPQRLAVLLEQSEARHP